MKKGEEMKTIHTKAKIVQQTTKEIHLGHRNIDRGINKNISGDIMADVWIDG